MKAVLWIFSSIVRISPLLGQMCPNMERDVRKDIVQKYAKIRGKSLFLNRVNGWKMCGFWMQQLSK